MQINFILHVSKKIKIYLSLKIEKKKDIRNKNGFEIRSISKQLWRYKHVREYITNITRTNWEPPIAVGSNLREEQTAENNGRQVSHHIDSLQHDVPLTPFLHTNLQ